MGPEKVDIVVQSGGKLFKSGAYGCIFTPPLRCSNRDKSAATHKGKLGKVTEMIDVKYEINASKYLGRFPESKKYFILPEVSTLCTPAPEAQQSNTTMEDCAILGSGDNKNVMQYEMEFGGNTLKSSLLTTNTDEIPFFDFMHNLLEIGAFLLLKGVVHNDMHGNNIVLDEKFRPRLIDFGRTYTHNIITQTLVNQMNVYYNPQVNQVPPEHTAQPGIAEGVPFETIMRDMYSQKMPLVYAERILGVSRKEQLAEFRSFWEDSKSAQSKDWLTFFKMYWPTIDSWAIGHNLIGILRRLLLSKKFAESAEWKQKQGVVKAVLRGLLKADPRRRMDGLEALAMYDPMHELVCSDSGRKWLTESAKVKHPSRGA